MSKRKAQNVPVATENAPIEQTSSEIASTVPIPEPQPMEQPKQLSQKERIDQLERRLAEFDRTATANFDTIGQYLEKLSPLVQLSEQLAQRQSQTQAPTSNTPNMGVPPELQTIINALLQGGSQDSEMVTLGKEALRSQIAMSKSITDAVVSRITGKAVAEVAEKLTT